MKKNSSLVLIGKRIKEIRMEKRISQEELAFSCDIHPTHISDIERGLHNVSALTLIKIAEFLKVEAGDFFPRLHKIKT